MPLTFEIVSGLVLQSLKDIPAGQYEELVDDVARLALKQQLVLASHGGFSSGGRAVDRLSQADRPLVYEMVRQAMWRFIVRGLLVPGANRMNPNWPFYAVTVTGQAAVDAGRPQPYDADGFIEYFMQTAGADADPVVIAYVREAVETFNVGCMRASAVMLGAASEKLILLAIDALRSSIADGTKKASFEMQLAKNWMITSRYRVFEETLEKVIAAKKTPLPKDLVEFFGGEMVAGSQLLRRIRNSAGHPEAPGVVNEDDVFMNLRFFPAYARHMRELSEFLTKTPLDW